MWMEDIMRNLQALARIQPLPAVHGGALRDFVEMAFISALFLAVLFVSGCSTIMQEQQPSGRSFQHVEIREPANTAK